MTLKHKILIALGLTLLVSCGTIVPKQPVVKEPSFDGNVRNSGFIGYTTDGYGIITGSKLAEYLSLVTKYGSRFNPPVTVNDGVLFRGNLILMDKEHLVKFAQMLDMERKELH